MGPVQQCALLGIESGSHLFPLFAHNPMIAALACRVAFAGRQNPTSGNRPVRASITRPTSFKQEQVMQEARALLLLPLFRPPGPRTGDARDRFPPQLRWY